MHRHKLNRFMVRLIDHLALSLLWLLSILAVITATAGTAALFEVARRRTRGEDPAAVRTFLRSVRHYFSISLLVSAGWAALGGVLILDLLIVAQFHQPIGQLLLVPLIALTLGYALVSVALFPAVVCHEANAYQLLRTAVLATLIAPGRAVLGLAVVAAAAAGAWAVPLSIIIVPSLTATAIQRLYQGVFPRLARQPGQLTGEPGPVPAAPLLPTKVSAARP